MPFLLDFTDYVPRNKRSVRQAIRDLYESDNWRFIGFTICMVSAFVVGFVVGGIAGIL